jgi:hypothetical protein
VGLDADDKPNPWVVAKGSRAARVNLYDPTHEDRPEATGHLTTPTSPATAHSPTYYTYSDFTGYQLRNITAPSGSYKRTFEGCPRYSSWKTLSWNATVPEGTRLSVIVRIANTREELVTAPPYEFTTSPANLELEGVRPSTFIQLEFILEASESGESPIIRSYELLWACEKPIG